MEKKKTLLSSVIVLYFIIAFEILIMISPFAGFFYSVFNPVLLTLAGRPSTRWLSAFFLPHMVLPSDPLLFFVRVMGSVLFILGMIVFFFCAGQVYSAKLGRKGAVHSGLYAVIRHPQYLGLWIAGLGLAILWPRILTIVLWLAMSFIYYFLAKDEERRMLKAHGRNYDDYMRRTGMFLPVGIEKLIAPSSTGGKLFLAVGFSGLVLAGSFLLRSYTIHHLTLWSGVDNVTALAILPEDGFKMNHRMRDILSLEELRARMDDNKHYLIYFMPRGYIMQGMIADTGGDWKLYRHHRTIGMIADWIFNPFGHLRGSGHSMHGGMHHTEGAMDSGVIRRLIVLSIEGVEIKSPADFFSINALRVPQFTADIDVHNLKLLEVKDLPKGTGWGSVPTPVF